MIHKNTAIKIASVKNLEAFLRKLCSPPYNLEELEKFEIKISSQKLLAHLDLPQHSIIPMSLNTIKKIADTYIDSDWNHLNSLRLQILEIIQTEKQRKTVANKTSKAGLTLTLKETKDKLLKAHKTNLILLQLTSDIIQDINDLAETSSNKDLVLFAKETKKKALAILAINSEPYNNI